MCFCCYNCMGDLGTVVKTEIGIWNCWAVQSKHTKGKNMLILIRLDGTKCVHVFRETLFFFKQQTLSTPTNRDKSKLSAYRFQLVLESVSVSAGECWRINFVSDLSSRRHAERMFFFRCTPLLLLKAVIWNGVLLLHRCQRVREGFLRGRPFCCSFC